MTELTQMVPDEEGGPGRRRIHLREITGAGELPLETVGQDLRAARLRRGDDLATVSKSLKIRKDHLEALEEDRIDNLPGKTYAIGFDSSYLRPVFSRARCRRHWSSASIRKFPTPRPTMPCRCSQTDHGA